MKFPRFPWLVRGLIIFVVFSMLVMPVMLKDLMRNNLNSPIYHQLADAPEPTRVMTIQSGYPGTKEVAAIVLVPASVGDLSINNTIVDGMITFEDTIRFEQGWVGQYDAERQTIVKLERLMEENNDSWLASLLTPMPKRRKNARKIRSNLMMHQLNDSIEPTTS